MTLYVNAKNQLKKLAIRGAAHAGSVFYDGLSAATRRPFKRLMEKRPDLFVVSPEEVERETAHRVGRALQNVIKSVTGIKPEIETVRKVIDEGMTDGLFENFGKRVYIRQHRINELCQRLQIPEEQREEFSEAASRNYLLRDSIYRAQAQGHYASEIFDVEDKTYMVRPYSFYTRDGVLLQIMRYVNQEAVETNDQSPSVVMFPGIACQAETFHLNLAESFALEQADRGRWSYLVDYRGMGINKRKGFRDCILDTLVSNDVPAANKLICHLPRQFNKPVVVIGHSMGGIINEFMLIRQAYKLRLAVEKFYQMKDGSYVSTKGLPRPEIGELLARAEQSISSGCQNEMELRDLIADSHEHLDILNAVKGLITLGSPKIFKKKQHPIWSIFLTLNRLLPAVRSKDVPVDPGKWLADNLPYLVKLIRPLIHTENFENPNAFLGEFVQKTDSFAQGIGLQFLFAIHSGKGIRRLGTERGKFYYIEHLDEIPPDIPIAHIYGRQDILAPSFNAAFVDHSRFGQQVSTIHNYPNYQHTKRTVHTIGENSDPSKIPVPSSKSEVHAYVVNKIGHLDMFYGQTAQNVVRPLINRLVDAMWQS
jgi:pimeloyl-ACP methyl ester carboxylesterase